MIIFLTFLVAHFAILSRLTFTAWPEMLSYPYLLTNGFILYKDLVVPYTPALILLESSFFKIFGFSPDNLRLLTWILIGFADLIMFLILRNITKNRLATALFLGLFILLQSFFDGNMLWFDFASEIPLLVVLLFIFKLKEVKANNLFWVGFFLGGAFMIKQIEIVYLPVFLIILFINRKITWKELAFLISGFSITTILFLIYLLFNNSLIDFWKWCIYYPAVFWSHFPGYIDLDIVNFRLKVSGLLLLPMVGVLPSCRRLFINKQFIFVLTFFLASLIAVYPRFSFFHLQPPIAFIVILFALIYINLSLKYQKAYALFLIAVTLLLVSLIYKIQVGTGIRFYSAEDKTLAYDISQRVGKDEKVWLLGLSSSEYVLADRLPSKPWLDNFGWYLEMSGVQQQVIEGMKQGNIEFIFWQKPQVGNWYDLGVYQPKEVVEYIKTSYIKVNEINNIEIWKRKN